MITRQKYLEDLETSTKASPVTAILGPRQCGKTTLARMLMATNPDARYFDLEDPRYLAQMDDPMLALEELKGLVIIDEIQRQPELLESLRVLADRPGKPAAFIILGSASPLLIKGASESLAGRVSFLDLSGFLLSEVGYDQVDSLWTRGGFPRSFLAENDPASVRWRQDFTRTFLERDIPQLGINVPAETLRRFWTMVAHYHGKTWNAAEFARSLGTAEGTARHYLEILAGAYMVRILPPWFENIKKRQVKAPKVYLRDTGILHSLLSLESKEDLTSHPACGASWEGFALEQILQTFGHRDAYFWATHSGAELDLLLTENGRRYGIEIKYTSTPKRTRSMHSAIETLGLDHLYVVYAGKDRFKLDEKIEAIALPNLLQDGLYT